MATQNLFHSTPVFSSNQYLLKSYQITPTKRNQQKPTTTDHKIFRNDEEQLQLIQKIQNYSVEKVWMCLMNVSYLVNEFDLRNFYSQWNIKIEIILETKKGIYSIRVKKQQALKLLDHQATELKGRKIYIKWDLKNFYEEKKQHKQRRRIQRIKLRESKKNQKKLRNTQNSNENSDFSQDSESKIGEQQQQQQHKQIQQSYKHSNVTQEEKNLNQKYKKSNMTTQKCQELLRERNQQITIGIQQQNKKKLQAERFQRNEYQKGQREVEKKQQKDINKQKYVKEYQQKQQIKNSYYMIITKKQQNLLPEQQSNQIMIQKVSTHSHHLQSELQSQDKSNQQYLLPQSNVLKNNNHSNSTLLLSTNPNPSIADTIRINTPQGSNKKKNKKNTAYNLLRQFI